MKRFFIIFSFLFITSIFAQPANDECANAIELTLQDYNNVNYTLGNLGDATESTPACSGNTSTDVWYKFTATSKANKIYLPPHSGLDLAFEIFDACGGNSIACVDLNSTSVSESYYDYHFTIGQTYYIKVFLYNQSFSDAPFEIAVISIPQPVNDDCSSSIEIPVHGVDNPVYISGNFGGATESLTPCSGSIATDLWYHFTATTEAQKIYLPPHSGLDLAFEVFDACSGNLVACVDNNSSSVSETYYDYHFTVGNTYYIRVYLYNGYSADADFEITVISGFQPNDDCTNSINLPVQPYDNATYTQANFGGATESMPACSGNVATDVWFSFTPNSSTAEIHVNSETNFNPVIEVFDACGGNSMACVDNNGINYSETYHGTNFIPGHQYFFRVFGHNQYFVDFEFQVKVIDPNLSAPQYIIDNNIKLYPNPATDKLVIENKNISYDIIQLLSINALLLFEHEINHSNNIIDISNLKKGLYLVKIINSTNNNQVIKKLMIK